MAYVSSQEIPFFQRFVAYVKASGDALMNWLVAVGEAQGRVKEIEALQALSDEQLKEKFGIERKEIAAFVFADRISI